MDLSTTTKKLAGTSVFVALAYVTSFLEIPIFSAVPFLKLDIGWVFLLLCGFMYGPQYAIGGALIKELLRLPVFTTMGVGELSNFVLAVSFLIIPTFCYRFKKGFKNVVIYLVLATAMLVAVCLPLNKYVNFPLYGKIAGFDGDAMFSSLWYFIALFNLIKGVLVSLLALVTYKQVKFLFEKVNKSVLGIEKGKKMNYNKGEYITKSARQTKNIGKKFAKTLKAGDTVILSGDLGAGKTVFVKGMAKGLNLKDDVVSPTYAYLNVYSDYLYHYDFYRLSCGEDAERLGLTDYFYKDNVCVFEWAENVKEVIDYEKAKKVEIEKLGESERRIIIR